MDITKFIVEGRDKALLYGDYSTYHQQLTKRLVSSRKKLGITTKNRGKFQNNREFTAEDIAHDREYVYLNLLTCERAWAHAMSIKSSHNTDQKGITGRTRSHIISRLTKAVNIADELVDIISQTDVTSATTTDILEAEAYASLIRGAKDFERQAWEPSLRNYATSRIIYSALAAATNGDLFKDLLSETIDPSIRYAAYQLKTPRTVPVPIIARKAFPESDTELVERVNSVDPNILAQGDLESKKGVPGAENAPKTLTWRSREVNIEDAQIALAWGAVLVAKDRLAENLKDAEDRQPHELAGAYDEILTATQDAVDATKQAIDEMRGEGVDQGDPRMQSLQITRTAVNFEMVSWRIGRNRVLTGSHDGATEDYSSSRRRKGKKADKEPKNEEKELPPGRKLAKLKEKVALYDGTLTNIESIKELPGVANDQELATRIDAFLKYFEALKCLSIARSHAIVGNVANALSLINHAHSICQESASKLPEKSSQAPPNVEVDSEAAQFLQQLLGGELQRHRAIVHIDNLRKDTKIDVTTKAPLIERLNDYPAGGVDLTNIVQYPPKMATIPMKPIFLDVAWNYIDYPGKVRDEADDPKSTSTSTIPAPTPPQQAKRGWFGFGRS
ncbi:Fc.00g089320.m01.CDS01 [Cosmosporella sp. VM-42]